MKISELSQKTGASIRSIRYYEKKNLIAARRLDNGYREFDHDAIERIHKIKSYLKLGLSVKQIERTLNCSDTNVSYHQEAMQVCRDMLLEYEFQLQEVTNNIHTLTDVQRQLQEQIKDIKRSLHSSGY